MIMSMDPIANIEPVTVELRFVAREDIGNLARNELLDILIRAMIVRAARNSNRRPISTIPGAYEQVGSRLGRRIRTDRTVSALPSKPITLR